MSEPKKSTLKAVKKFSEADRTFVVIQRAIQYEQGPSQPLVFLDFEGSGLFWATSDNSQPCGERVAEVVRIYDDEDDWEHFRVRLDTPTPITLVFHRPTSPTKVKAYDAAKEAFANNSQEGAWPEQLEVMRGLVKDRPPWPERDTIFWGTGVWRYQNGQQNLAVAVLGEGLPGLSFRLMGLEHRRVVDSLAKTYTLEPAFGSRVRDIMEQICEKKGRGLWFDDPVEIVASDASDALDQLFILYTPETAS